MLQPGWVNPHRYQVPTYIESREIWSPRGRGVFFGARENRGFRAQRVVNSCSLSKQAEVCHTRENDKLSTIKVLPGPNVKVVFHHTAP